MSSNLVAIARTEASIAVNPDDSLEDRFRAAMKVTHRHWMATDEDDQFLAAIEAVYLTATDKEKERIEDEMKSLRDLSALLSGVPVDPTRIHIPDNPIGIRIFWAEQLDNG